MPLLKFDMSEKDNASLALAVSRVYPFFSETSESIVDSEVCIPTVDDSP